MDIDLTQMPRLDDEELSTKAPFIRAQVAMRYEQLWHAALPGIMNTQSDPDWRPDPRYVEAGIRILRNMAHLYRLDEPAAREREEVAGTRTPVIDMVESALTALEARQDS